MAFSSFNTRFARVGPQNDNAPTIWTYFTTDSAATVDTAGYFSAVADRVKVGDFILASCNAVGVLFLVNQNTRDLTASPPVFGVVDVTNNLLAANVDSD